MTDPSKPTPQGGGHAVRMSMTVVPRLALADADAAIDFYRRALGAELVERVTDPDGRVVHAELRIGTSKVSVKDADDHDRSPADLGGSPIVMQLDTDDVDAVAASMEAAGATVVFPVGDQDYGYRDGRLQDPFGLQWLLSQRLT